MAKSSTDTLRLVENQAEGSNEAQEPQQFLKMNTMPTFLDDDRMHSPAETGIISAIELPGEGRDQAENQDAPRIDDFPKTAPQSQTLVWQEKRAPVILIVEDTTELAEVIQATLERMNMKTFHETHGTRAINVLDEAKPDVVLLDISLPDMTGWKILDVIKEKAEQGITKMPVIIIITAYGDPANRLVGKLQGVYSYLIKPFTADEVERVVTDALNDTVR